MRLRFAPFAIAGLLTLMGSGRASAQDIKGVIKEIDLKSRVITLEQGEKSVKVHLLPDTTFDTTDPEGVTKKITIDELQTGFRIVVTNAVSGGKVTYVQPEPYRAPPAEFWHNFTHNLFKPLLLFFYMGFLIPILKVKFEFPYVIYQGLTIYLLIAIGWKGGEELAHLNNDVLGKALGFMLTGFITNFVIGVLAYVGLSLMTKMRRIDKATVAGYYGSDSAGTFVTCVGVLSAINMKYEAYMPVMLAIMEIPGCLVALYLVSRLRATGMDPAGTMPDEPGYDPNAKPPARLEGEGHGDHEEKKLAMEETSLGNGNDNGHGHGMKGGFSLQLLHEVFLNPGLYLLFGGILIGFISGKQGPDVTRDDDNFFIVLFQGILCLFLLEMGMTASRKLKDLRTAGIGYIIFGILAPVVFAAIGILVAHGYAKLTGADFGQGTYVLFAVLCAAASYIAVPAVQRLAIPEASPTLPLAASLGLTFSFNVTLGIPIYIQLADAIKKIW